MQFDLISKVSFQSIFLQSSERWLGVDLHDAKIKLLDTTINLPTHRAVDYLRHVVMPNGEEFILHIEFQTEDYEQMHLRMAEYRAILQRTHKLAVRQYLVYLGATPTKMISVLPVDFQIIDYEIISLNQLKVEDLLKSDLPDEVVLAILSDYSPKQANQVVHQVLRRLESMNLNPDELKKYLQYLLTLGQLRNLESHVKQQVQAMPITIDVSQSSIYKEGHEKGKESGLIEGFDKGAEKTKRQVVLGLLRLGKISVKDIAESLDVSVQYVLEIKKSLESK